MPKKPPEKTPFPFWPFLGVLLCLLLIGYGMLDVIRNLIHDFLRPWHPAWKHGTGKFGRKIWGRREVHL